MAPLRSTRSSVDSRVSLVTSVKAEPEFTTLRRSTRSTKDGEPSTSKLNLSSFAYDDEPRKRLKTEVKEEMEDASEPPLQSVPAEMKVEASTVKRGKSRSGTSTPKNGQPTAARAKAHPEPARWKEQYALIERMRAGIQAPVDTMGCERPLTFQDLDAKTLRFHILISLMLSSQTKDAVTSQAVVNLHEALEGGLTAESLAAASSDVVSGAINKVGFWRRKTDYIQEAARTLLEQPGEARGDVPQTIEELCQLKGVGPKMGFLALQAAWNINAGIGVDVHVHRITNRLKWHKPPTKTPEETRVNLESWLPPEFHRPINPLLVGFGQVICLPIGPRCDICLLGQQKICPSRVAVNAAGRKEVEFTFTSEDGGPKVEIGYEEEVKPLVAMEEVKGDPTAPEEGIEADVQAEAAAVLAEVKDEVLENGEGVSVKVEVKEEPL